MADIFISYAREDRERARPLAQAVEESGWEVWWDPLVESGQSFQQVINSALEQVECVVVLWSEHSLDSQWVLAEAMWAHQRERLITLCLDDGLHQRLPVPFNAVHADSFADWSGDVDADVFRKLVSNLAKLVGSPPAEKTRRVEEDHEREEERKRQAQEAKRGKEERRQQTEAAAKHKAEEEAARRHAEEESVEISSPCEPAGQKLGLMRRLGANQRALTLAAMVVLLITAYGGLYYYTESIAASSLARPTPLGGAQRTSSASSVQEMLGGGEVSREEAVNALEWLADARLRQDMLTDPPADNAHYYYSRLLPLDQEKAAKGFAHIAERYVVLAEKEFSQSNFRQAQTYITLGLQVEPSNAGLLSLQSFIDNRKESVFEGIINFFTGSG